MPDTASLIDAILDDPDLPEHMVTMVDDREMRTVLARHLTGWVYEHEAPPEDLSRMSAHERGVWLSIERVYDASLRAEGIEKNERSRTAFRDLVPDAQQAVIVTLLPVVQMLHAVALNPEARRGE